MRRRETRVKVVWEAYISPTGEYSLLLGFLCPTMVGRVSGHKCFIKVAATYKPRHKSHQQKHTFL